MVLGEGGYGERGDFLIHWLLQLWTQTIPRIKLDFKFYVLNIIVIKKLQRKVNITMWVSGQITIKVLEDLSSLAYVQ